MDSQAFRLYLLILILSIGNTKYFGICDKNSVEFQNKQPGKRSRQNELVNDTVILDNSKYRFSL